ncbi:MAG: ribosome small subunit-dependent GTPase A, partial [Candidatus Hydrothermae bacterium]|nr:ribosome small subunit-dependent GTPase A [Candidatus Hydrothermae bacterium]
RVHLVPREGGEWVAVALEPRKRVLVHPPVANVDRILSVVTLKDPVLDEVWLNRMLVGAEALGFPVTVVINKADLLTAEDRRWMERRYGPLGYPLRFVSARTGDGLDALRKEIGQDIVVLAGPSGVGKTSLLNRLLGKDMLPVGELSQKTRRGRHTTSEVRLLRLPDGGYVADTPGFSQIRLGEWMEPADLDRYFPEFQPYLPCAFRDCTHHEEPGCNIRAAVERGEIPAFRLDFYHQFREELVAYLAWKRKKRSGRIR